MSIEKNKFAVDISRNVERMEGEPDDDAILKTLVSVVEHFKDERAEISLHVVEISNRILCVHGGDLFKALPHVFANKWLIEDTPLLALGN